MIRPIRNFFSKDSQRELVDIETLLTAIEKLNALTTGFQNLGEVRQLRVMAQLSKQVNEVKKILECLDDDAEILKDPANKALKIAKNIFSQYNSSNSG